MTRRKFRSSQGFMLAPLLYMLALAGIGAAVMFSGYSQILRSNAQMTATTTVRSQLQSAGTTLAASATLDTGVNPNLVKPPAVYSSATVAAGSDAAKLPTNYASTGSTGTPHDVGVIDVSTGVRQLDPWGKFYMYCRWEQQLSSSSSPALMVISAGPDGVLQTKCGDTAAQGDDKIISSTVAETVNRANVWQVSSSSQVKFGLTANPVAVNADGSMTAYSLTLTTPLALTSGGTGASTASAARTNLGATATGGALFTAASAAAARSTLGSTSVGDAVFIAASAGAGRTALGSGAVGDTLFTAATAAAGRATLGSGAVGDTLFTAATAAAARTTLGSGTTGDTLFTAATAGAARTTLGSTTVGDALFIAADAASARTTLGLGTMAVQNSNNVNITGGSITNVTITGGSVAGGSITGTVAIANGGTGATTAAAARSNLGTDDAGNLTTGTISVLRFPASGVTAGTYTSVTVDVYGRVTAGTSPVGSSQWTTSGSNIYYNTGSVGIGTASPAALTNISGAQSWASLTTNPMGAQFIIDAGASTQRTYIGSYWTSGVAQGSAIQSSAYYSSADHYYNLLLNPNGGNVGIGTTAPGYLLDVRNATNTNQIHLSGTGNDDGGYLLGYGTNGMYMSGGSSFNGTSWVSKSTAATILAATAGGGIRLYTDNSLTAGSTYSPTPRMTIDYSGNVGIGTTSPSEKLEVSGTGNQRIKITNTDGAGSPSLQLNGTGGLAVMYSNLGSGDLRFYTAGNDRVTITTGGNVGIGTASPSGKLTVTGNTEVTDGTAGADTASYGSLGVTRAATANRPAYLAFTRSGNFVWAAGIDSSNGLGLGFPTAGTQLISDANTKMTITSGGNVGIGTASPGDKLQVYNGRLQMATDTTGGSLILSEYAGLARISAAASGGGGTVAIGREPVAVHGQAAGTYTVELWSGSNGGTQTLVASGGKVGIGTSSPSYLLDVTTAGASSFVSQIYNTSSTTPYGLLIRTANDSAGFSLGILNAAGNAWADYFVGNGMTYLSQTGGYTQIGGSVRAPIFYDTDNTGYYVDPNGSSSLSIVALNQGRLYYAGVGDTNHYMEMNNSIMGNTMRIHEIGNVFFDVGGNITIGSGGAYIDMNGSLHTVQGANFQYNGDVYMPWAGVWLSQWVNQDVRYMASPTFNQIWANAYNPYSDQRLKENIRDLAQTDGLDNLMKLRPVRFRWKDAKVNQEQGEQIGFIAQEMETVYPELVHASNKDMDIDQGDGKKQKIKNFKTLSYMNLAAPLVKAVQELKTLFDALAADVKKLAARVDEAFAKLASHDGRLKKLEDENGMLKAALCKLDAVATFCKRPTMPMRLAPAAPLG